MRQDDFVARYQVEWDALGRWLDVRARPKRRSTATGTDVDDMEFTSRYRRVCQHLAIARRRGYSPRVQQASVSSTNGSISSSNVSRLIEV